MHAPVRPERPVHNPPRGSHSIHSIDTATAAFVGRTSKGPEQCAVRLTGYREYEHHFGAPHPDSDMAASVALYFANGGRYCHVVRIAGDSTAPGIADYTGDAAKRSGWHALDDVDPVGLVLLPHDRAVDAQLRLALWEQASRYCAARRAFLLVDAPADWSEPVDGRPAVTGDTARIDALRRDIVTDQVALFFPRLRYRGSTVAPSGAVAGLMARVDQRRGVWHTPAGFAATIRGISGVECMLSESENDRLNSKGVNCIRSFVGRGAVNWGGRTLAGDDAMASEWKYIAVRRLALMIEASIERGTRWAVFESNDQRLWGEIRNCVGDYMHALFRQGAFRGASVREAYSVRCGLGTTMTQRDVDDGIVIIEVGFAPLKPAEFVILRIRQRLGR